MGLHLVGPDVACGRPLYDAVCLERLKDRARQFPAEAFEVVLGVRDRDCFSSVTNVEGHYLFA